MITSSNDSLLLHQQWVMNHKHNHLQTLGNWCMCTVIYHYTDLSHTCSVPVSISPCTWKQDFHRATLSYAGFTISLHGVKFWIDRYTVYEKYNMMVLRIVWFFYWLVITSEYRKPMQIGYKWFLEFTFQQKERQWLLWDDICVLLLSFVGHVKYNAEMYHIIYPML